MRSDSPEANKLIEGELVPFEFADGERGSVDRKWRHDSINTRAVGQSSVADRRGLIDSSANLTDNALTNIQKLLVVAEANARLLDLAQNFDVNGA